MNLSDEQLQLIHSAMERYGTTGLARKLGISRHSLYSAIQRKSGLNHLTLQAIQQLMLAKSKEMPGNAPSVAIEPPQGQTSSDTAGLLRLLYTELPKLSETNLAKVYRYVVELQIKQEAE